MKCNLTVLSVPVTQVLVNLVLVICSSLFVLCIRKKSNPSVWDKRSCSGGVCHVGIPDDQHLDLSPRVLLVQQSPGKHHSSIHHSENSVSRPLGTCITCHERPKAISIVLGGEHQQEFPPGKVLIVPAAVLSLRGMLVKISGLEEKGSKWSLCRVRGVLSSGAAAPRAQPCMSWDGAGTPGCCSSRVGAVCQAWLPGQEAGAGPVWEGGGLSSFWALLRASAQLAREGRRSLSRALSVLPGAGA